MKSPSRKSRPAPQCDLTSSEAKICEQVDLLDRKPAARRTSPATNATSEENNADGDDSASITAPTPSLLGMSFDVQINSFTYLRATDLSALQQVSRHFADRSLINAIIRHTAKHVYPPSLTEGFDTPEVGGPVNTTTSETGTGSPDVLTYEMLRNMEMLVVARVLSRPEPTLRERECGEGAYYVSKAWCRTALRWLERQQEEQREAAQRRHAASSSNTAAAAAASSRNPHASKKKKKKPSRKDKRQEKIRNRKLSDALPPWQNINTDLLCPHGDLARFSSKSARARRRIMDKQAWRVLNKLYPDSVPISSTSTDCVQCLMEQEIQQKNETDRKEREKEERKRPLSCPVVRGIYTRSKGVPSSCLAANVVEQEDEDAATSRNVGGCDDLDRKMPAKAECYETPRKSFCSPCSSSDSAAPASSPQQQCPLVPGVYNALPRSWCHRWRKFLKSGEGDRPVAPDSTDLLCLAHRLPLIPPHLESFLYGETSTLLVGSATGRAAYFADDADAPLLSPSPSANHSSSATSAAAASPYSAIPVGLNPVRRESTELDELNNDVDQEEQVEEEEEAIISALRAAGLSESEVEAQRQAMLNLERQSHMAAATGESHHHHQSPHASFRRESFIGTIIHNAPDTSANTTAAVDANNGRLRGRSESINEQLDRENYRVVELLTDAEFCALEKWWPDISVNYALRFAVTEDDGGRRSIVWSTPPCRECDATGKNCREFSGRMQRARRIRRNGTVPNGKGR